MSSKMKKVLLCVTGGIAAYKAIDLASKLKKQGFAVKTVLTQDAMRFVSPLNFEAITQNSCHHSLWDDQDPIPHITLSDWADIMVVAPATANTIAKAAGGIADSLLSSTLLAFNKSILWVPAMNMKMFDNPATVANLDTLTKREHFALEPDYGMLACGYEGKGKYPPNEEIVYAIRHYLERGKDLAGKKVLVTAGATVEDIDPMRMVSNKSSGKMGLALARALHLRGAVVFLIHGTMTQTKPYYLNNVIEAKSVQEMYEATIPLAEEMDWVIKCAAVSDYKPACAQKEKIKKGGAMTLELLPTKDILAELGEKKKDSQLLIGFAAETRNLIDNAKGKLKCKNLDLIVANSLENAGKDDNSIVLISKDGQTQEHSGNKFDLANLIIDRILKL